MSTGSSGQRWLARCRREVVARVHHVVELARRQYRRTREQPVRAAGGEPVTLVAIEDQGREQAVFHHGTCPVNHRSAQAAANCRRGEAPVRPQQ